MERDAVEITTPLVIVPTYNETENLPALFERLHQEVPDYHLLIVDDGSPDGTADLAERLGTPVAAMTVMRRTGVRGLGVSYVDGYLWALGHGYARVVQMDADLSHDPRYIRGLVEAASGADVVLGSRYCRGGGVRNWPLHRQMISRFANAYVSAITGLRVHDATSGFRCYSADSLRALDLPTVVSNGYAFQVEMTFRTRRSGLKIAEVPIVFTDRVGGQSKMSGAVVLESVLMPWRLRFGRSVRRQR